MLEQLRKHHAVEEESKQNESEIHHSEISADKEELKEIMAEFDKKLKS